MLTLFLLLLLSDRLDQVKREQQVDSRFNLMKMMSHQHPAMLTTTTNQQLIYDRRPLLNIIDKTSALMMNGCYSNIGAH